MSAAERHLHIVPWNNTAELQWVKRAFFMEEGDADERIAALSRVAAWATRTKLPHWADSTATITSAIIADVPGMPTLTLRLLYATAFCRFVNGLLDPMQKGPFAISMHNLARELGLPASFVELRHAASHEDLPSLSVFREAARRALQWLWIKHWAKLEDTSEVPETSLLKVRDLLKMWRRLRRENPTAPVVLAGEIDQIVKDCIVCARDYRELLIEALFEEKALVPAGQRKSKLMKGAVLLWKPLLQLINATVSDFIEDLLSAIVDVLRTAESEVEGSTDEELLDSLEYWANEIISGMILSGKLGSESDLFDIAEQCIMSPNKWTLSLLEKLSARDPALSRFRRLMENSKQLLSVGSDPKAGVSTVLVEEAEEGLDISMSRFEDIQKALRQSSQQNGASEPSTDNTSTWRVWQGTWEPTPIGRI